VSIIFFDHYDPATGEELWLNSGEITNLVKDINPGPGWSSPEYLTAVGSTLFFTAYDDTNGYQLWKTDGTAAGTVRLTSFAPGPPGQNGISGINVNGTFFFGANDGIHGFQLWKSDGTVAGTVMVTNFSQGLVNNAPLIAANGNVFFTVTDGNGNTQLWKSDGTATGTTQFSSQGGATYLQTVVGSTVYFVGSNPGNIHLFASDGTPSGTMALTNTIYPSIQDNSDNTALNGVRRGVSLLGPGQPFCIDRPVRQGRGRISLYQPVVSWWLSPITQHVLDAQLCDQENVNWLKLLLRGLERNRI
jgi:ELWxxDGT repeat protein